MSLASRRRVALAAVLVVTAALGTAPSLAGPTSSAPGRGDDTFVGAGGYTYPSPTNAAKVFGWGVEAWRDEFEHGTLRPEWRLSHARRVRQQQGQLTLDAGPSTGTVRAAATDQQAAYGRWETRVRAKRYDDATPYRFFWELVPVRRSACPDRSDRRIVVASWEQDDARAVGSVGVDREVAYTFGLDLDLRIGYFHTYAIEVARDHVSWFVDTEVVHTERRPEALTGTVYRPRLRMQAVPGATMARSRMQADWVRFYDLDRPGAQSVDAPGMTRREQPVTC